MRAMSNTDNRGDAPTPPAAGRAQIPLPPDEPGPPPGRPVPPAPPGPSQPPPAGEPPLPGETVPPAGDPPTDPPVRVKEVGGPAGPEPTRYGDWERKGRVSDF